MNKKDTKKAINFDLDTKELLKHFKNTHQAYSAIKVFMEDNSIQDMFQQVIFLMLL